MRESHEKLLQAVQNESERFREWYLWLESAMPASFFEEVDPETIILVAHSLMGLQLQDYFSEIHLKQGAIVLCLDSADADLRILKNYTLYGIRNYRAYLSTVELPSAGANLRIGCLRFTESKGALAEEMFIRAKTRDNCQYEVKYDKSSMQIALAWRNTPKHNFLYRLAGVIHRHGLIMKKVNATYTDPYSKHSILTMVLELHGSADIPDFLRDLVTVKYFDESDAIGQKLVAKRVVSGNMGNFLRAMVDFIHQSLVHIDANIYTLENVEEALLRHPELTVKLCEAFQCKFDPDRVSLEAFEKIRLEFMTSIHKLDTGQVEYDLRRKNILKQGMLFIVYTLKTNFFRHNYTAISFRLDPHYLDELPFDRTTLFPEMPYAIFFMKGMYFFGFHLRFRDLARGGLRTVLIEQSDQLQAERNNVFTECYNLAYTQQKKNKDIPEGGAKGVIFLLPFERLESEATVLRRELEEAKVADTEIENTIDTFRKEQRLEYLYHAQRAYVESLLTLINCEPDGTLKAKYIIDYWKRPEYLYLGPDENMHDSMIEWIANLSKKYGYKPAGAFISSKPLVGINHKQYGVTSLGLQTYVQELLHKLGLEKSFTVKMSGGPDGDVAGNQILNLYKHYPKAATLLALTDGSGTIYEPEGLDLKILVDLFNENKAIRFYPADKLSEGGFLLDKSSKRYPTALAQQTLLWRKRNGKLQEEWLSSSEMNALLRGNVHRTVADLFIPAGGRPRTLNANNYKEFLDETGKPTSKAIVEGANLYLTEEARRALEELGVLIIKDSSANKGGVICSSFEVLCGLVMSDDEFLANKETIVAEILERIHLCALKEARLLLQSKGFLTDISEQISEKINRYTYQLLEHLDPLPLGEPLIRSFLSYCLPLLRNNYREALIREVPDHHKKAIIACHLASELVYSRGLDWSPTVVDVLPLILADPALERCEC